MPGRAVGAAGTIPVTTTARHVTRERRSVNRDSLHGIPCSFANSLLEGLAAPLRETGLTANGILRSCLFEGGEIPIRVPAPFPDRSSRTSGRAGPRHERMHPPQTRNPRPNRRRANEPNRRMSRPPKCSPRRIEIHATANWDRGSCRVPFSGRRPSRSPAVGARGPVSRDALRPRGLLLQVNRI